MMLDRRPNRRWRVRIYAHGQVVDSRTFDLKRDALAWEAEQKRRLQLGDVIDPAHGRMTVEELFRLYLEAHFGLTNPHSFDTAEQHIRLHLVPRLGRTSVGSLSVRQMEGMYQDLLRSGLAVGTVRRIRDTLSSVFAWGARQGFLANNIVRGSKVTAPRGRGVNSEIQPFTSEELRRAILEHRF